MAGAVSARRFAESPGLGSSGNFTITMPPHLGHLSKCPIAAWLFTMRRDLQVVQVMENGSTSILQFEDVRQSVFLLFDSLTGRNQDDVPLGVIRIRPHHPHQLLRRVRRIL